MLTLRQIAPYPRQILQTKFLNEQGVVSVSGEYHITTLSASSMFVHSRLSPASAPRSDKAPPSLAGPARRGHKRRRPHRGPVCPSIQLRSLVTQDLNRA